MHRRVINPRHDGTAHVLQSLDAVQGAVRLYRHDLHGGRQLTQAPTGADDGAARTKGGDEVGDAPGRLCEDLWTGRLIVRVWITGIVVLIRIEVAVAASLRKAARHQDGSIGTLQRIGVFDLSPIRAQDVLALLADVA